MTRSTRSTFLGFAVLAILTLQSCGGIKPGSTRSAKNLYTTFFVGDDGLQYFIKPIEFSGAEGEELQMDITFRYKDEVSGKADIRFTYVGQAMIKKISRLEIGNEKVSRTAEDVDLVYVERVSKKYHSRQSARLSLKDTQTLFASHDWVLKITTEDEVTREFRPKKKTERTIDRLNLNIFEML